MFKFNFSEVEEDLKSTEGLVEIEKEDPQGTSLLSNNKDEIPTRELSIDELVCMLIRSSSLYVLIFYTSDWKDS